VGRRIGERGTELAEEAAVDGLRPADRAALPTADEPGIEPGTAVLIALEREPDDLVDEVLL
jgi:hypothetical protein